jgi:glycosyltransferase involved in cell wall biosynthesis
MIQSVNIHSATIVKTAPRPRVLQVITHLAMGGAERVAFTLMHGLADQFEFHLFAVSGMEDSDVGRGFLAEAKAMQIPVWEGTRVPIKMGGMFLAGGALRKTIRDLRPDVVHLHTEIPESAYAAAVMLRRSVADVPLVRTIHNTVYWDPWRKLGRWCERRMHRPFVAAVSEPSRVAFQKLRHEAGDAPLGAPAEVIFNGLAVDRAPARQRDGGPVRLLFAGRFEDQKGADLLPEIIRQTRVDGSCDLTIHGNGTHEGSLRALAANPPAGWSIALRQPVPNLVQLMPGYDLLLMPSRYEGLSLMAMESLLSGLPVVATDGPGLRDGFPPDYPWLAKAGDAASYSNLLSDVLANPAGWSAVADMGHDFARKHFDVGVMCAGYAAMYERAIVSRA